MSSREPPIYFSLIKKKQKAQNAPMNHSRELKIAAIAPSTQKRI